MSSANQNVVRQVSDFLFHELSDTGIVAYLNRHRRANLGQLTTRLEELEQQRIDATNRRDRLLGELRSLLDLEVDKSALQGLSDDINSTQAKLRSLEQALQEVLTQINRLESDMGLIPNDFELIAQRTLHATVLVDPDGDAQTELRPVIEALVERCIVGANGTLNIVIDQQLGLERALSHLVDYELKFRRGERSVTA